LFLHEVDEMVRFEYSVSTRADRNLAWKIFTNIFLWRRFADVYGDIEWTSGAPWTVGSRLKIGILGKHKTTVDHVITALSHPHSIAWIDHFMGNTMEQWVQFDVRKEGGTSVRTWAEITGSNHQIGGKPTGEVVATFIRGWFDRFREECDQMSREELQLK
jgi:hypothetical protein